MPLFSRHAEPEPAPAPVYHEPAPKKHSLFGGSSSRHRSPSPHSPTYSSSSSDRHRSTSRDSASGTTQRKGSLLSRTFGNGPGTNRDVDPSIMQARERVMMAEAAERDADRALMAARESVRQAREHVRALELEAQEEARRAKIKQYHAKEVSKMGRKLGRHGV